MRIGFWRNNRDDKSTDINYFALSQDSFFGKLALFEGRNGFAGARRLARLLLHVPARDASPSVERGRKFAPLLLAGREGF